VSGAIVLRPSFTPVYELENIVVSKLAQIQRSVHHHL
jgi:hypothetical protein